MREAAVIGIGQTPVDEHQDKSLRALTAGLLADAFGGTTAIAAIGLLTFLSDVIVTAVMRETLSANKH